uniref:DEF6 guanine nucleotide exchange factor n=1 Tax=Junco hyemalis TaxID=40217 RepID=A0A8C5JMG2_JUNHY
MDLRAELLKSIWYAFTALDVEKSGKVSKSQLKVLSHNLYTVLCIPHDPVALEEHFRDDDDGPVSSQGYMPYLNKYILDKVEEGAFVKENFDELCWTLTAKKNYKPDRNGNSVVSHQDAFKLWCLFNFLSEDKYPLVMVPDEVEYLLKKICTAMNVELNSCELEDFLSQEPQGQGGLTVWQFLDMVNSGRFLRGIEQEAISMAVEEVYQEVIEDVLKQGYLWKKGQLRRNWSERWFMLKPSALSYYMSEERKEKKGSITLDKHCCVEVLPDRDGKRCMFCVKTSSRTYEMSQEMENKNKCLEEAQKQLEEVRVNRQRVDQDVMAAQWKLRQASTNVKHWNVQMNRLMHPIGPGDKRTNVSGGVFAGYQPLLSRRDSSLKLKQRAEDKGSDPTRENSKENVSNGGSSSALPSPDADTMATEPSN